MFQAVILMRRQAVALGCVALLAACAPRLGSIAPRGFEPADRAVVDRWLARLIPVRSRLYELRPWRYRNENGSASGRAAIRIVPPDSMRFDYRGPFGKSGNAVLVGDSALWMSGEDFEGLVTYAPLFWTALGMPPVPPAGVALYSLTGNDIRAWRYILAQDTLDFVLQGSPARRLLGEIRRQGVVLAQATVELDTITGLATKSRIDFYNVSRFEFTVLTVDTLASFDSTIWQRQ
jgi:hypothetical protein